MATDWWWSRSEELIAMAARESRAYILNEEILNEVFFDLLSIDAVDRLFYPIHTNSHPHILEKAFALDIGFLCVSRDEIANLIDIFPQLDPQRILFLSDAGSGKDVEYAFHAGVYVITDPFPPGAWPKIFQNRRIFICGDAMHEQERERCVGFSLNGYYLRPQSDSSYGWALEEALSFLVESSGRVPEKWILILGNDGTTNGRYPQAITDIPMFAHHLDAIKDAFPGVGLWLEVPDPLLHAAGVLLVKVIETGIDGGIRYIRVSGEVKVPGYDDRHRAPLRVVNLSRPDSQETGSPTCLMGQSDGGQDRIEIKEAPAVVEVKDTLLLTPVITYGWGMNLGVNACHHGLIYYLRARSMCPVKI